MTAADKPGPEQGTGANGLWVPPSAKGRSFHLTDFEGEVTQATEVGDIQFTTDYVILFGLDGNIIAKHHTDVRSVVEVTDRTPPPVAPEQRPSRVEL